MELRPGHPPAGAGASADYSGWHELIRLRDATRETIVRHAGEPLL